MKIYKKRIIILVCSNMAGSEKYPLPFVGKRTHPLHFSNTRSLPGTCHHIEAAWVICKIALNLWSLSLSLSTDLTSLKYCFCWSVPYTPKIEEICKMSKFSFFFCKHTAACRPGYYLGCKQNFPRSLVVRLLQKLKSNEDFYRLSLHDAMTVLWIVWSSVTWETVADCSVAAGFSAYAVAGGQVMMMMTTMTAMTATSTTAVWVTDKAVIFSHSFR